MKALDTGPLLALLAGSRRARELVRKLRGSELATTEANLLELAWLAAKCPAGARKSRLAALERLRQRITVLPLDARATREVSSRLAQLPRTTSPTVAMMLGALQAAGCEELLTDEPIGVAGDWSFILRTAHV